MLMKVKDLPANSQPRERMLKYGVENLSDVDLISIIIRTGTKDANVKDVATNILNSVANINSLSDIGIRELSNIKGVGSVKAISLLAAIELGKRVFNKEIEINMQLNNATSINETFAPLFLGATQEKLLAIFLDTKKRLIAYKFIFIGTIDRSIVHPREIYNEAIKVHASSLIIMHNHPTGDVSPSKDDIATTNKIKECGDIIGIPLLDHLITNGKDYYSFYDKFYKK